MPGLQHDVRDLMNGVGHYLGYNVESDPLAATLTFWDADQLADVKRAVNGGYRQFLYPPTIEEDKKPYEWTFLTPAAQVVLASGVQTSDLPTDYGGVLFGAVLRGTGLLETFQHQRLEVISQERFEALTGNVDITSGPTVKYVAALRPVQTGTTEALYKLAAYPTPSDGAIITFRYMREPLMLDATQTIPWGGDRHSETIMQSCLAVAELFQDDEHGVHWERFLHRLRFSIAIDERERQASDSQDSWPIEETEPDEATLQITYQDMRRECGFEAGYGRDSKAWTHEQFKLIEFCVQNGYRAFLAPPLLEGQKQPWDWSFNKPVAQLVTAANVHKYDVPADCGSIVEEFTYEGTLP